jgi:homoserine kinase
VARGLGASAIARVGGLLAANALAGHPLDKEDILLLATEMEGHADNAAPAIFGGLQIVARRDDGGIVHMELEPPPGLRVVLFVPQQELPTALARQAVPQSIPRADAVYSLARVALLVAALATGRLEHLAEASDDRIHQPYRARLFPPLRPLLEAAMKAGAQGAYLSGAGPTVAAFALEDAERVAQALDDMAARMGLAGRTILTSPTTVGAHLAEESP